MSRQVDIGIPGALVTALGLSRGQMADKLAVLAALARARWIRLAQTQLRSTSDAYVSGIQNERVFNLPNGPEAMIALKGNLANNVEWGQAPYDMRTTLLDGKPIVPRGEPGVHQGKHGVYRSIPFRHMTPGTKGRNAPAMGSAYANDGMAKDEVKKLERAVYNAAKRLGASVQGATGTQWGGRLPAGLGGPKLREHHTTGLYTGMVRVQKQYDKTKQNYYMTFRTISRNPNAKGSWMHPGITPPRHFMFQVRDYIEAEAAHVMGAGGSE